MVSLNLQKDQTLNLTKSFLDLNKNNNASSHRFSMGLGWDPAKSGWFGFGTSEIDLDASALLYNANNELVDTVWFRQLRSKDGAVVHSGDNLTGEGDGDDETISVDVSRLNKSVTQIVFVITSFRGQTFDKVDKAQCRVIDDVTGQEVVKYVLSDHKNTTGQIMAKIFLKDGEWSITAIGKPVNGTVQSDLHAAVRQIL